MVASADRPLPRVILESGTALRPPASAVTIEAAAHRVGAALPPAYVAFLAVSDGAYASGCGIVTQPNEYGLLPAATISRLVEVAPDHVGLWVETFGAVESEPREDRSDGQAVRNFAAFGSAILLTPMIDAV